MRPNLGLRVEGALARLGIACVIALCPASGWAQLTEASWSNGRLTIRASDAPLPELLAELSVSGIITLAGQGLVDGRITATVENVPVPTALSTILQDFDYVVRPVERPGAVVHAVRILGRRRGGPAAGSGVAIPLLEAARFAEHEAAAPENAEDPAAAEEDALVEEADLIERVRAGAFETATPLDSLLADVDDINPLVRVRALEALAARGTTQALPHLIKALGDESPRVADLAVEELGRMADSASLRAIAGATEKSETLTRLRALRVFARRGDRASLPYARQLVGDEDQTVRMAAAQLIGALSGRER